MPPPTPTETKFSQWMTEFGVTNLVGEMRKRGPSSTITHSAAYQWMRGEHEPRPKKQRAMVEISGGKLTLQDIADHFEARAKS